MKKTIKVIAVITMLVISLVALSGCGLKKEESGSTKEAAKENVKPIDDNKSYFISINGEKFYAGDKITDLDKAIDYNIKSSEETQNVPANKYMIGSGTMVNDSNTRIFSVTPYNTTSESTTVPECSIGGFEIHYSDTKRASNVADIEVYGGLKLGSTEEEVKAVFGEPSNTTDGTGYKSYQYQSKETYRNYKFTFDDDGKVTDIVWKNFVFNK